MSIKDRASVSESLRGGGGVNIEDCFSTYVYTGNGTTQDIVNGIDLATDGGMVWIKDRGVANQHCLLTTDIPLPSNVYYPINFLATNSDAAMQDVYGGGGTGPWASSYLSNGFSLYNNAACNANADKYTSWTFKKQPRFFDQVKYTGNGVAGREIPHELGCTVGNLIIKATSRASNWSTFSRDGGAVGSTTYSYFNTSAGLNLTAAAGATGLGVEAIGYITDSLFKPHELSGSGTIGNADNINDNGVEYIAYLFAHDPLGASGDGSDGMIACGSFTTDGSGVGTAPVDLGWEPQYLLVKTATATSNWKIVDNMRGFLATPPSQAIDADSSAIEGQVNIGINATGFNDFGALNANATIIYMAIRRPMKTPLSSDEVYNAIARTGTSAVATVACGFTPDLVLSKGRNSTLQTALQDRLRGVKKQLLTCETDAESSPSTGLTNFDVMDGIIVDGASGYWNTTYNYTNHFFKRAKGFFDVVAYTGNLTNNTKISHNMSAVPEMIWVKDRLDTQPWCVYHKDTQTFDPDGMLFLHYNGPSADTGSGAITAFGDGVNIVTPTETDFTVGQNTYTNSSTSNFIAYLFATLPNISKCGSYTGNGTSQTIDCGFSTGSKFILIKRTDSTGDWYFWDSVRGIVAGNDPHLSLNTTAAEVTTDDSIDPDTSGFIVNQNATTNINVTSAEYIYYAIAEPI
jgi:hypothetical protein